MSNNLEEIINNNIRSTLVLVGGPSNIGKTTIINSLLEQNNNFYSRPVSFTTRPKRENESENEYKFIEKNDIELMDSRDELLNLDDVYGNLYAISNKSVEELLENNKTVVKEIHPKHFNKIMEKYPDAISVLLLPINQDYIVCSEDVTRKHQDISYYSNINTNEFDIVFYIDNNITPNEIAENLNVSIRSFIHTNRFFPRPRLIDDLNRIGYQKIADEFSDSKRITTKNFHDLSVNFFQSCIDKYIKPNMKCLEIGPGQGWLRKNIKWPEVDYIAADISTDMLMFNDSETTMHSSVRSLKFPSKSFDIVIASLADPYFYPSALCEIRRILKDDGLFIFSTPSHVWAKSIRNGVSEYKTQFKSKDDSIAEVYSFTFEMDQLIELMNVCGYNNIHSSIACGSDLPSEKEISIAITRSSSMLGIKVEDLEIINLMVAKKKLNI